MVSHVIVTNVTKHDIIVIYDHIGIIFTTTITQLCDLIKLYN